MYFLLLISFLFRKFLQDFICQNRHPDKSCGVFFLGGWRGIKVYFWARNQNNDNIILAKFHWHSKQFPLEGGKDTVWSEIKMNTFFWSAMFNLPFSHFSLTATEGFGIRGFRFTSEYLCPTSHLGEVPPSRSWQCHQFNIFKFTVGPQTKGENLLWKCSKNVLSTFKKLKTHLWFIVSSNTPFKKVGQTEFWIKCHRHFTFLTSEVCKKNEMVFPRREALSYTSVFKNKQNFPIGRSSEKSQSIENIYSDF